MSSGMLGHILSSKNYPLAWGDRSGPPSSIASLQFYANFTGCTSANVWGQRWPRVDGLALAYLTDDCVLVSSVASRRHLRSADARIEACHPENKNNTGRHAETSQTPVKLSGTLPSALRLSPSLRDCRLNLFSCLDQCASIVYHIISYRILMKYTFCCETVQRTK